MILLMQVACQETAARNFSLKLFQNDGILKKFGDNSCKIAFPSKWAANLPIGFARLFDGWQRLDKEGWPANNLHWQLIDQTRKRGARKCGRESMRPAMNHPAVIIFPARTNAGAEKDNSESIVAGGRKFMSPFGRRWLSMPRNKSREP
jgi:hypothetical protein